MIDFDTITAEVLKEQNIYDNVCHIDDHFEREQAKIKLLDRAKELKCKSSCEKLLRVMEDKVKIEKANEVANPDQMVTGITNFDLTGTSFRNLLCGAYIASDQGIFLKTDKQNVPVSYVPILPIGVCKNMETNEESIEIAYKSRGRWVILSAKKGIVASANTIIKLADEGFPVTSNNAKYLVQYLADLEMLNVDDVKLSNTTSKFGWIEYGLEQRFIPYDDLVKFDGESRFRQVSEAIKEAGSFDLWMIHVKEIRKTGRLEPLLMMAGSLAGAILPIVGSLPFFVDLWGETERGKTVVLMLAASIWADPSESKFIGDFKTTDTALEAKADLLNNLPVILDDTSNASNRIRQDYESLIYQLTSGKGKSRSNKSLGLNRENHWATVFLTNGERPLSSYLTQGGAYNRVLEVQSNDGMLEDPVNTASIVKENYGHLGKRFIEVLKEIEFDEVRRIYREFFEKLARSDKMQKQERAMAVILTADKIASDHIFRDGVTINVDEAAEIMVDRDEVSENARCYYEIMDYLESNPRLFSDDVEVGRVGDETDQYAIFIPSALEEICRQKGHDKQSFLEWCRKRNLLYSDDGKFTKKRTLGNRKRIRCNFIKKGYGENYDDGFVEIDESEEQKLPFC